MPLLSTNDYSPAGVGANLVRAKNLNIGRSKIALAHAIDITEGQITITLKLIYGFSLDKSALIFDGIDPNDFRADPKRHIERCAFCGLDLRDAFDQVELTITPPFNVEKHIRQVHAACVNAAFGRMSQIEFFVGTGSAPTTTATMPGNGDSAPFKRVLDRVIESEHIDLGKPAAKTIAAVEEGKDGTIIVIDVDYRVSEDELDALRN